MKLWLEKGYNLYIVYAVAGFVSLVTVFAVATFLIVYPNSNDVVSQEEKQEIIEEILKNNSPQILDEILGDGNSDITADPGPGPTTTPDDDRNNTPAGDVVVTALPDIQNYNYRVTTTTRERGPEYDTCFTRNKGIPAEYYYDRSTTKSSEYEFFYSDGTYYRKQVNEIDDKLTGYSLYLPELDEKGYGQYHYSGGEYAVVEAAIFDPTVYDIPYDDDSGDEVSMPSSPASAPAPVTDEAPVATSSPVSGVYRQPEPAPEPEPESEPVKAEPTTGEELVSRYGNSFNVVGTSTIDSVKHYILEKIVDDSGHHFDCSPDPSETNHQLIVRSYVNSIDYSVRYTERYLDRVNLQNLVVKWSHTANTEKRSWAQVSSVFDFEFNVPLKVDQSYAHDREVDGDVYIQRDIQRIKSDSLLMPSIDGSSDLISRKIWISDLVDQNRDRKYYRPDDLGEYLYRDQISHISKVRPTFTVDEYYGYYQYDIETVVEWDAYQPEVTLAQVVNDWINYNRYYEDDQIGEPETESITVNGEQVEATKITAVYFTTTSKPISATTFTSNPVSVNPSYTYAHYRTIRMFEWDGNVYTMTYRTTEPDPAILYQPISMYQFTAQNLNELFFDSYPSYYVFAPTSSPVSL